MFPWAIEEAVGLFASGKRPPQLNGQRLRFRAQQRLRGFASTFEQSDRMRRASPHGTDVFESGNSGGNAAVADPVVAELASLVFASAAVPEHPIPVIADRIDPPFAEGQAVAGARRDVGDLAAEATDHRWRPVARDVLALTASFAAERAQGAVFVVTPADYPATPQTRQGVPVASGDFHDFRERFRPTDRHRPRPGEACVRTRFDASLAELSRPVVPPGHHFAVFEQGVGCPGARGHRDHVFERLPVFGDDQPGDLAAQFPPGFGEALVFGIIDPRFADAAFGALPNRLRLRFAGAELFAFRGPPDAELAPAVIAPGHDAAVFEHRVIGASAGGDRAHADPRQGVHDFRRKLAFAGFFFKAAPSVAERAIGIVAPSLHRAVVQQCERMLAAGG